MTQFRIIIKTYRKGSIPQSRVITSAEISKIHPRCHPYPMKMPLIGPNRVWNLGMIK